ncbi:MAG: alpha-amylase family glycosyl hydrolase, partial [Thiohalomonadales bacterium]
MQTRPNTPLPLGAQLQDNGINFSLFSRHATSVSLLLFDKATDAVSSRSILLDIEQNKTGDIWHIWIEDLRPGCLYAWQVDGPDEPAQGHRFNSQKILLDPYAVALAGTECWNFGRLCDGEPSGDLTQTDADAMAKCLVPACNFDWQGVQAPRLAWADTIIYETHVRGLTVDPSSAVSHAGTFRGLTEKLPYLKELGITAIELLPIQDFFENELTVRNPATGEQLRNYWGYSTVAFFAPKEHYACGGTPGSQINEFKT